MKKILLIAFAMAHCNLQAMWFETKIKKVLPKQGYVLSAVVHETKNEGKEVERANTEFSKNSRPTSVTTSDAATNNGEFFLSLSDIRQSSSDFTETSSAGSSAISDYLSILANQTISEEVFSSIEAARSLPNFSSSIPFYEDDGIFDMEMSSMERSSSKYSVSEECFPHFYREKQLLDSQKRENSMSHKPIKRRKSSIDMYYSKHK